MAKLETGYPSTPVTQVIGDPKTGTRLCVQHARIVVISGPDKGLGESIPPHGLIIGKSASCDIRLTDAAVSATHFRITPTPLGFRLEDLGSSNGTWLRDVRVGEAYVNRRESIVAGQTTLRLDIKGGRREYPLSNDSSLGSMIGRSVAMRQVFALLEHAASSDSGVLIEGESGTGKELAAEAVHLASPRKNGPFVVVDCSNMKTDLVESHLFGHVKGAFTGATSDQMGAFEAAQGGTVFLDEIGELEPALQANLLRVVEKKQVRRIGENTYRPVDFRLIAATLRNLKSEMESGRFRQDLYYRLSVLRVHLPALRDRREDIPLIAFSILNKLSPKTDPDDVLTEEMLDMFARYDWPGNVRELRNVIERLLVFRHAPAEHVLAAGRPEKQAAASFPGPDELTFHEARNRVIENFERTYAMSVLKACDGVVAHAAKRAGVTRPTFHRLVRQHNILKMKSKPRERR